jgi:hypothetical protein
MSDLCLAGNVLFTSGAMRNHMLEADTYEHRSQYLDTWTCPTAEPQLWSCRRFYRSA